MKRLLSILLIVAMMLTTMFVLTGCQKGRSNKPYAEMTPEDLISFIKNKNDVTVDEWVELIESFTNVKIKDDLSLEDNITEEALKLIDSDAKPKLDEYISRLLDSDIPQVRGYGISLITSLTGVSSKNLELAKNLIKHESNEYVLYQATKALSNEAKSDPDVAKFLLKMAEHSNAKIRQAAASALGNSWSEGVDGAVDAVIKLMKDENKDVRKTACRYSGKLHDEKVIEPLVQILNNEDDADIHGSAIEGLCYLWYDYPFFKETSEKAYNATMDYYKKTPRTEKTPDWTSFSGFKTASTQDSYKEWKEKATYFNTDELYNVMVEIVKDSNANYLARTSAMDVIKAHCGDDKWTELKSVVDGLSDSKATSVKSAYDSKSK